MANCFGRFLALLLLGLAGHDKSVGKQNEIEKAIEEKRGNYNNKELKEDRSRNIGFDLSTKLAQVTTDEETEVSEHDVASKQNEIEKATEQRRGNYKTNESKAWDKYPAEGSEDDDTLANIAKADAEQAAVDLTTKTQANREDQRQAEMTENRCGSKLFRGYRQELLLQDALVTYEGYRREAKLQRLFDGWREVTDQ